MRYKIAFLYPKNELYVFFPHHLHLYFRPALLQSQEGKYDSGREGGNKHDEVKYQRVVSIPLSEFIGQGSHRDWKNWKSWNITKIVKSLGIL